MSEQYDDMDEKMDDVETSEENENLKELDQLESTVKEVVKTDLDISEMDDDDAEDSNQDASVVDNNPEETAEEKARKWEEEEKNVDNTEEPSTQEEIILPDEGFGKSAKEEEKKKEEKEEIQQPHTKHPHQIPVIDYRLLAGKLSEYDWLHDLPEAAVVSDVVEVRFKNTRKGFFINTDKIALAVGDIVAVEAQLGHDIGVVSLTGELVKEQMKIKRLDVSRNPLRKIYRKAKPHDIERWQAAIALEHQTMIKSRQLAADLHLEMKIGDVEYQGDGSKAIFYYIADGRVDFRQLIKVLADAFHIRIEMKQIGARQEAGLIGGIGPCGRKLCCSSFITNFTSVSTSAARYQDISLNPQKLAGQCGKLKCCLNYEVDAYVDAQQDFPSPNVPLNTGEGILYHFKSDIFGRNMTYCFSRDGRGLMVQLPINRVKEIILQNRKGIIPPKALINDDSKTVEDIKYTDGVGEESLNRFDKKGGNKRHSRPRERFNNNNTENSKNDAETQNNNVNNTSNGETTTDRPKDERNFRRNNRPNNNRRRFERRNNDNRGNGDAEKQNNSIKE